MYCLESMYYVNRETNNYGPIADEDTYEICLGLGYQYHRCKNFEILYGKMSDNYSFHDFSLNTFISSPHHVQLLLFNFLWNLFKLYFISKSLILIAYEWNPYISDQAGVATHLCHQRVLACNTTNWQTFWHWRFDLIDAGNLCMSLSSIQSILAPNTVKIKCGTILTTSSCSAALNVLLSSIAVLER